MNILIKNGTIVSSTETKKESLLFSKGKIIDIGETDPKIKPDRIIDASNKLVFPGGIDPHVHLALPTPAGPSSDDFLSGSLAALHGGTTTIIDFETPNRGQPLTEALEQRINEAQHSLVDYSFHVSPVEWNATVEQEIIKCITSGFPSLCIL